MILAPGSICSSSFLRIDRARWHPATIAHSSDANRWRYHSPLTPSPDSPGNYSFGFILKNRGFIIFLIFLIFQPTTELPNHMTPYHSCRRIIVCNFFLKSTRITRTPSPRSSICHIYTKFPIHQFTDLPSPSSINPSILQLDIPSNVR
jgi:hypothetical protein